ncbi:unnamed protein product [Caenorhabditis sp. 36 PRJEB53466]|nr:unnamed protein product [Caenorhabditis sp. 36 PRJEB53466]
MSLPSTSQAAPNAQELQDPATFVMPRIKREIIDADNEKQPEREEEVSPVELEPPTRDHVTIKKEPMTQEERDEELKEMFLRSSEKMAEVFTSRQQLMKKCENDALFAQHMDDERRESVEEILEEANRLRIENAPEREMEERLERERKEVEELETLNMERSEAMRIEKQQLLAQLSRLQNQSSYLESMLAPPALAPPALPSPSGEGQAALREAATARAQVCALYRNPNAVKNCLFNPSKGGPLPQEVCALPRSFSIFSFVGGRGPYTERDPTVWDPLIRQWSDEVNLEREFQKQHGWIKMKASLRRGPHRRGPYEVDN